MIYIDMCLHIHLGFTYIIIYIHIYMSMYIVLICIYIFIIYRTYIIYINHISQTLPLKFQRLILSPPSVRVYSEALHDSSLSCNTSGK